MCDNGKRVQEKAWEAGVSPKGFKDEIVVARHKIKNHPQEVPETRGGSVDKQLLNGVLNRGKTRQRWRGKKVPMEMDESRGRQGKENSSPWGKRPNKGLTSFSSLMARAEFNIIRLDDAFLQGIHVQRVRK